MGGGSISRLALVERWSPTLFLVAGPLVLIPTVFEGLNRFASASIPEMAYWPLLPLGFALSLVGILGLYPRLVERARWSAAAGLGLGLLCLVLFIVGFVVLAATRPESGPPNLGPSGPMFFLGFVLSPLPIAIYGLAGFRTGIPSRSTWGLLVALALVQFVEKVFVLGVVPVYSVSPASDLYGLYMIFAYTIPMAIIMVAIGYSLRRDSEQAPAGDASDATT